MNYLTPQMRLSGVLGILRVGSLLLVSVPVLRIAEGSLWNLVSYKFNFQNWFKTKDYFENFVLFINKEIDSITLPIDLEIQCKL